MDTKDLEEFWSHEKMTEWYRTHPIFQASFMKSRDANVLTKHELASNTNNDTSISEVTKPEKVIPLRLFGDGAESTRVLPYILKCCKA